MSHIPNQVNRNYKYPEQCNRPETTINTKPKTAKKTQRIEMETRNGPETTIRAEHSPGHLLVFNAAILLIRSKYKQL